MPAAHFMNGFADELLKTAAKVRLMHGTSGTWRKLRSGVGDPLVPHEANARGVYGVTAGRGAREAGVSRFAREAVKSRGGKPSVAYYKGDTRKGLEPRKLSPWGEKNIGDIDDAKDLVDELETATGARRGEVWRTLNKGVGSWRNLRPGHVEKPMYYRSVDPSPRGRIIRGAEKKRPG